MSKVSVSLGLFRYVQQSVHLVSCYQMFRMVNVGGTPSTKLFHADFYRFLGEEDGFVTVYEHPDQDAASDEDEAVGHQRTRYFGESCTQVDPTSYWWCQVIDTL